MVLVCTAVFVAIRYWDLDFKSGRSMDSNSRADFSLPAGEAEDLQHHLNTIAAALDDAAAGMNKSQLWIDRAMTTVEYDPAAGRRLQLGRAAQGAAALEIGRAREELEIVKRMLTERSTNR
jgi:hypothetical protein